VNQRSKAQAVPRGSHARPRRPRSVTLIAWYTIINSLLHAVMLPQLMRTSLGRKTLLVVGVPLNVVQSWTLASSLIHAIAGIAMLRQRNWGRVLYLGFWPVALTLTVILYGVHLYDVVAAALYALFFIVLTRPTVAAFFRSRKPGVTDTTP